MSAPLNHLKILDFSTLLPGPYATMMLGDLGADIIRIEAPHRPDLTRLMPPHGEDGQSAQHATLNRGKRSLGLNLKNPAAAEIVKKLVVKQEYDIIVEQFRPGVMDKLGVGYAQLQAICPHLIFCSLTGYGQTGPYKDRAGHDLNYLALSGLLSQYGRKSQSTPPSPLPTQVADLGAGSLHLVVGLLAAVIRRLQTGEGGHVDISMFDGALAWNVLGASKQLVSNETPTPEGELLNGGTFYDIYETADGRFFTVGSLEPQFWQRFCQAIGREDLIQIGMNFEIDNQQQCKQEIRAVLHSQSWEHWRELFAKLDVCVEPVLNTKEALSHPQTQARNMIAKVPNQRGKVQKQLASPIKLTGHEPNYEYGGSPLGWHTNEVLRQIGYTKVEIKTLYSQKVVAGAE